MFDFVKENAGTFLVGLLLIIAVIVSVRKIVKDKKAGKSCGCGGCSGCPSNGVCHSAEEKDSE